MDVPTALGHSKATAGEPRGFFGALFQEWPLIPLEGFLCGPMDTSPKLQVATNVLGRHNLQFYGLGLAYSPETCITCVGGMMHGIEDKVNTAY